MKVFNECDNQTSKIFAKFLTDFDINNYSRLKSDIDDFNYIKDKVCITISKAKSSFMNGESLPEYVENYGGSIPEILNSVYISYKYMNEEHGHSFSITNNYEDETDFCISDVTDNNFKFFVVYGSSFDIDNYVEWIYLMELLYCEIKWDLFWKIYDNDESSFVTYNNSDLDFKITYIKDGYCYSSFDVYEKYLKHIDMEGFLRDVEFI